MKNKPYCIFIFSSFAKPVLFSSLSYLELTISRRLANEPLVDRFQLDNSIETVLCLFSQSGFANPSKYIRIRLDWEWECLDGIQLIMSSLNERTFRDLWITYENFTEIKNKRKSY